MYDFRATHTSLQTAITQIEAGEGMGCTDIVIQLKFHPPVTGDRGTNMNYAV